VLKAKGQKGIIKIRIFCPATKRGSLSPYIDITAGRVVKLKFNPPDQAIVNKLNAVIKSVQIGIGNGKQ